MFTRIPLNDFTPGLRILPLVKAKVGDSMVFSPGPIGLWPTGRSKRTGTNMA